MEHKRTYHVGDFDVPAYHRMKMIEIEKKKKHQILGSGQRAKKAAEHQGYGNASFSCFTWYDPQMLAEGKDSGNWKSKEQLRPYTTTALNRRLPRERKNQREKEREYESEVDRVSWAKKNNMS